MPRWTWGPVAEKTINYYAARATRVVTPGQGCMLITGGNVTALERRDDGKVVGLYESPTTEILGIPCESGARVLLDAAVFDGWPAYGETKAALAATKAHKKEAFSSLSTNPEPIAIDVPAVNWVKIASDEGERTDPAALTDMCRIARATSGQYFGADSEVGALVRITEAAGKTRGDCKANTFVWVAERHLN